jgi:hypothetical protein
VVAVGLVVDGRSKQVQGWQTVPEFNFQDEQMLSQLIDGKIPPYRFQNKI